MSDKQMELVVSGTRCDLSIERDSGNQILILMGGGSKKRIRENWEKLRHVCNQALAQIELLRLEE